MTTIADILWTQWDVADIGRRLGIPDVYADLAEVRLVTLPIPVANHLDEILRFYAVYSKLHGDGGSAGRELADAYNIIPIDVDDAVRDYVNHLEEP